MWLVWRRGCPDPSRPSSALHYADPAQDRDISRNLAVIAIASEHRGMSLHQLLTIDAYNLPASARAEIDGETIKAIVETKTITLNAGIPA